MPCLFSASHGYVSVRHAHAQNAGSARNDFKDNSTKASLNVTF
jgi:hypothetical protein